MRKVNVTTNRNGITSSPYLAAGFSFSTTTCFTLTTTGSTDTIVNWLYSHRGFLSWLESKPMRNTTTIYILYIFGVLPRSIFISTHVLLPPRFHPYPALDGVLLPPLRIAVPRESRGCDSTHHRQPDPGRHSDPADLSRPHQPAGQSAYVQ